jgi:hypothetical protein
MNSAAICTYLVGIVVVLISIAGLANVEWKTELDKLTGHSRMAQTFVYIVALVAGAFVLKDQYQAMGGGSGGSVQGF